MKSLRTLCLCLLSLFLARPVISQDCHTLYGAGYNWAGSSNGVRAYNYATNSWGVLLQDTSAATFPAPNTINNGGPIAIDPLNQNINFITDAPWPFVTALFNFGSAPNFVNYPASLSSITAPPMCSGYKGNSHVCYYMTQNHLSSFPTPAGQGFYSIDFTNPAVPLGKIYNSSLAPGSPLLNTFGGTYAGADICFDANGTGYIITGSDQLYTVVTDETAMTATFTYITKLSGLTFTPCALAFDPVNVNCLTITGIGSAFTNYNLSTNTLNVLTTNAGWNAGDLASCVFPNMSPALQISKTFYDSTQSKGSLVNVATGDIIRYTITVTNTGNENAGGFTIADALPSGTTYIAGSTTLNGAAFPDASGNSFPFATATAANSSDQTVGDAILSTFSTAGNPNCVIQYLVKVNVPNNTLVSNTATASVTGYSPTSPITVQGTSSFTVGQTTLPVTLLSFTAVQDGDVAILDWSTTNEVNNSRFDIQRSLDGSYYSTIGTVTAVPVNGHPVNNYNFTDPSPALGNNYYRLKQIDIDGNATYSPVQDVDFNNLGTNIIKIFPNPARGQISVTLSTGLSCQELIVKVMNSVGQIQSSQSFSNVNDKVSLDIGSLSKGVYYITARADGKLLQPQKLIVD